MITSLFDYIQIADSKVNNYNLCNLVDEFKVESNVTVYINLPRAR
jgi:hypothetical protein